MNSKNKNFALIGAAGFVAPRHMRAIQETGNELVAIMDINDSVGIIDRYFPNAYYFSQFERFDRFISKFIHTEHKELDFISICSPNYVHDAHIRFALRNGIHAICEKPLVLNTWNLEALQKQEELYQKKVYTILQLRLHPSIQRMKEKVEQANPSKKWEIELTYITSRGNWYLNSWKGDLEKSGGLATNIGIHFFDMLQWIFGEVVENEVYLKGEKSQSGFLDLEKAKVKWFLSIDAQNLPDVAQEKNESTFRSITIDGEEIEFSSGFENLHTKSYEKILQGNGFGLKEALPSIEMVQTIRNSEVISASKEYAHPYLLK